MRRHINNPYKVNWKFYGCIGIIFVVTMIASVYWNCATNSIISDIAKNISYGNLASTFVALLIEIGNTKDKNEKANCVYDEVYSDLKAQIFLYLKTWADVCATSFRNFDYDKDKYTWMEWYEIIKRNFEECDISRQNELLHYFINNLSASLKNVEEAIETINKQQYLLRVNNIYNEGLKGLLDDYGFEFRAAKTFLEHEITAYEFWSYFDAVKNDLERYIYNWRDIRFYNFYRFKPYGLSDSSEILRAEIESEKRTLNCLSIRNKKSHTD